MNVLDFWETTVANRGACNAVALAAAGHPALPRLEDLDAGALRRRLLTLHAELFGDSLECLTDCPACGATAEFALSCSMLSAVPEPASTGLRFEVNGIDLEGRLPAASDLLKISTAETLESAAAILARRCIVRIEQNSRPLNEEEYPVEWRAALAAAIAEADPLTAPQTSLTCPACGFFWSPPFDIGSFLALKIEAAAARVFDDVHEIASAYGWTQPEILSLSPARRAAYLERIRL